MPLPLDKQRQVAQKMSNRTAFLHGPFRTCHQRGTVKLLELPKVVLDELQRLKILLIAKFGRVLCTGFSFTTGFVMALAATMMCRRVTLFGFTPTADAKPPRAARVCERSSLARYAYYSTRPWWASGLAHMTAATHTAYTAERGKANALMQRQRHFFELEAAILHEWSRREPNRLRIRES